MGSGPDLACASEGAPGCMGVAGQKPSDAGEGAASTGLGLEPIRVGSGLACAAVGAPGCKGIARQELRDAGEGAAPPARQRPGQAGSPHLWGPAQCRPVSSKAR